MSVAETWFGVNVSELAAACSGICVVFLPSLSLSLYCPPPPARKKKEKEEEHMDYQQIDVDLWLNPGAM